MAGIFDRDKMTSNNLEKIDEIKKYYSDFDTKMDEARELAKQGKLVEEEVEE